MKKNNQFNILRNDSTTHGGYHTGTLSLSNISSVLIHGDHAKIDLALIHAKSSVERGIKFTPNREEVTNGEEYWIIWVAVDRNEIGPFYAAATACPMIVDREKRVGWKNLAFHVNRMDDALKKRSKLDELPSREKETLRAFLISHNEEMWNNSVEMKKLFGDN